VARLSLVGKPQACRGRLSAIHIALAPTAPLNPAEILGLRLREHLALDALARGSECPADLAILRTSAAVARALCFRGYGADEIDTVTAGEAALRSETAGHGRAAAVAALLELHEGQRMAVSVRDYVRALASAKGCAPTLPVHARPAN
jgi:hypothetical protein